MNDDTISRQAAIDAFRKELCRERVYATPFISFKECERILNELPSAERRGRWEWEGFNIVCSECDYSPCFDSTEPLYHFCPNCGARMEVE